MASYVVGRIAFDRLAAERIAIMRLADGIQHALSHPATSGDLQQVAFEVIDGHDRRMRPYLSLEADILGHVIPPDVAAEADKSSAKIMAGLRLLRRSVESGQPLRPALEEVELALRAFIDDRQQWTRSVQRRLSPAALARVEMAFEDYVRTQSGPRQSWVRQSLATK